MAVGDLLDAFALIALAADEPAAADVELLLHRGQAATTAIGLAEAIDVLERRHAQSADILRAGLGPLLDAFVRVVSVDEALAWRAAALRARHYDRRTRPLSLADCVLLAAAGPDDAVATGDRPLMDAAQAEGIAVIPLAVSSDP